MLLYNEDILDILDQAELLRKVNKNLRSKVYCNQMLAYDIEFNTLLDELLDSMKRTKCYETG